jgi:uncharacterized protein YdaU (DUF1376 family)
MKRPWYKRYGADFVHGTLGLTLEEKGAYSIVLDLIYDRGGPIPDDPQYIAGICGCSVRRWNAIRNHLVELNKLIVTDGGLTNERAEKELENSRSIAEKREIIGRKGGDKKRENRHALNNSNELPLAEPERTPKQNTPYARASQKLEARSQSPESSVPSLRSGTAAPTPSIPEATDPEKALNDRGKEVLGKQSGGMIRNLLKAKGGDIALARAAIETASTKSNPREYIGGVIRANDAVSSTAGPRPPSDEEVWTNWLNWYAKRGTWPAVWGDPPGDPHCRVPKDFIDEFNAANGTSIASINAP